MKLSYIATNYGGLFINTACKKAWYKITVQNAFDKCTGLLF